MYFLILDITSYNRAQSMLFRRLRHDFTQSRAFLALSDPKIKNEVLALQSKKVTALAEVIMSLTNAELEYLNLLQTERRLKQNQSVLTNRMLTDTGAKIKPIQHFYQKEWIKTFWKDTHLLWFATSPDKQEIGEAEEVQAVKDSFDLELTEIDAGQKIKIIKALREAFNLGLKQAKEFADKTPVILKKNVKTQEAQKLKKLLDAVGCKITLK